LGVGDTATCTINNNDIAPQLTLVKTVTNDNGGTADASAWTLNAGGRQRLAPTIRWLSPAARCRRMERN
jgi:hypothetical protein